MPSDAKSTIPTHALISRWRLVGVTGARLGDRLHLEADSEEARVLARLLLALPPASTMPAVEVRVVVEAEAPGGDDEPLIDVGELRARAERAEAEVERLNRENAALVAVSRAQEDHAAAVERQCVQLQDRIDRLEDVAGEPS